MKWLLICFLIFIFGLLDFFSPLRSGVQYIFNPVQFGIRQSALEINEWVSFMTNIKKVYEENQQVITEREKLISENVKLKELILENELLKKQLGLNTNNFNDGNSLVLSQVLGAPSNKSGAFIVLDKGQKNGISIGDVVVRENYLVGIVREVSGQRSQIELITSPNLIINVSDERSKVEGVSQGQFGTAISINRILPKDEILHGDIFITNGKDGMFPPNLIVGQVEYVSGESPDVLKTVTLSTMLNFNNLGKVFVLVSK